MLGRSQLWKKHGRVLVGRQVAPRRGHSHFARDRAIYTLGKSTSWKLEHLGTSSCGWLKYLH